MKSFSFLALTFTVILFSSCNSDDLVLATGKKVTLNQNIENFTSIEVSDDIEVRLTKGTKEGVVLTTEENIANHFNIRKVGSTLKIEMDDDKVIIGGHNSFVDITYIGLTELLLNDGAKLTGSNLMEVNDLTILLDGDVDLELEILSKILRVKLSGDSNCDLKGQTESLNAIVSNDSKIDALGLETNKLMCDLNGSSAMIISVNETLEVNATGESTLTYRGNGQVISKNLSGDSKIIKL
jgi:hypothetical protein